MLIIFLVFQAVKLGKSKFQTRGFICTGDELLKAEWHRLRDDFLFLFWAGLGLVLVFLVACAQLLGLASEPEPPRLRRLGSVRATRNRLTYG